MKELRRMPSSKHCMGCMEAVLSSRIYCERLGEYVDDLVYCPYFKQKYTVRLQAIQ